MSRSNDAAVRGLRVAALCVALAGCVPSPGPFVLDAVEGRVVDEDSGAPIAGAEVIEWWRGAGTGGPAPHHHARWTRTGADGRFELPRECAPGRMWLLRSYGPSYSFYHPEYGLEHARLRETPDGALMSGSKHRARERLANLDPICRGERDDPGARHLANIACPDDAPRRPR